MSALARSSRRRRPDGFVPASSLPGQEQLPAAPLVIAAYAVVWLLVFGYLWSIWQPARAAPSVNWRMSAVELPRVSADELLEHDVGAPDFHSCGAAHRRRHRLDLGSRAAQDAFAAEMRRREERGKRNH